MVIVDMVMPNCCYDCPAFDDNGDYPTCGITHSSRGYNFPAREQRMPECPLSEISLTAYMKAQIAQLNRDKPDFLPMLSLALKTGDISMKDLNV